MKKLTINNGAVVLVPVTPTGFSVGVVINADGRGRAIGAFFGPAVNDASEADPSELRLETALLVCRFGDHALHKKRWTVVGSIPNWDKAPWSVTKFSRRHDNPDLCYVTEYDEAARGRAVRFWCCRGEAIEALATMIPTVRNAQ